MTDAREMQKLRPWPNSRYYHDPIAYQSDRAEAAIARLRVAVRALEYIADQGAFNEWISVLQTSSQALVTIGEIPDA